MQAIIVYYLSFLNNTQFADRVTLKCLDYGLVRFCAPQYLAVGHCHGMSNVEDNCSLVTSSKYCCLGLHLCCAEKSL